jgi:carboxypeptidase D
VATIPGMPIELADSEIMHAGPIPISDEASLFFWLFRAKVSHPKIKLVMWFNGGPGCSSMDGVFVENGVFKMTEAGAIEANPYSWNQNAHMLYRIHVFKKWTSQ